MDTVTATLTKTITSHYKGTEIALPAGRTVTLTVNAFERAIDGHRVKVTVGKHRHGFTTIDGIKCA